MTGRRRAPHVATARVMARTLGMFYVVAGVGGVLSCLGSPVEAAQRVPLLWIAVGSAAAGLAIVRWGPRWPRRAFHLPVAGGTVVLAVAVLVAPDQLTAVIAATITCFVGVNAFFFDRWEGLWQVIAALALIPGALLLRGDVPVPLAFALDPIIVAVGVVSGRLAAQASQALLDGLTGLANRRGFDEALQELVRPRATFCAALLDLDHFKQVNDTAGHEAGDVVLRQVARAWRRALPDDAVLARHGGDEFGLLLPGVDGPAASALLGRLRTLVPGVSVSCGVAQYRAGETGAQVMRRADQALYAAKAAGRGRVRLAAEPLEPTGLVAPMVASPPR